MYRAEETVNCMNAEVLNWLGSLERRGKQSQNINKVVLYLDSFNKTEYAVSIPLPQKRKKKKSK